MSTFLKHLGKDTLAYLPSKFVPALANFAAVLLFTRLLGPSEYGNYVVVMTTANVGMVLFLSWLRQPLLRYFEEANGSGRVSTLVSTVLNAFGSLFIIACLALFVVVESFDPSISGVPADLFLVGMLVLGMNGGFSLVTAIMRSEIRTGRYSLFTSIKAVGQVALGYVLIRYTSLETTGALLGIVFAGGTLFLLELAILLRNGQYRPFQFDTDEFKRIMTYGVPFIGSQLSSKLLAIADNYILLFILGSSAVGTYGAGYKIIYRPLFLMISLVSLSAYPRIVNAFESKSDSLKEYIGDTFRLFSLVAVPATLGIVAVGNELVTVAVDPRYHEVMSIVPWVAAGTLIYGFGQIATYPIQLKEQTKYLPLVTAGAAASNVALNFVLIPQFGLRGAAITTLLSYFFYTAALFIIGRRQIRWSFPTISLFKIAVAAIGMYILVEAVRLSVAPLVSLIIKSSIGVVSYAGFLLLLRQQDAVSLGGTLLVQDEADPSRK